jgi:hypothetical protein
VRYASDVIRQALLVGFAGLSLLAKTADCGDVDSSSSPVNAPCTRDNDCMSGLTCQGGVCSGPGGEDAGVSDAAVSTDAAADG